MSKKAVAQNVLIGESQKVSSKASPAPINKNLTKARTPKVQKARLVNPESSSPSAGKMVRAKHLTMDVCELQSQDSTSFDAQSARGGELLTETLPLLTSELETLPKIAASTSTSTAGCTTIDNQPRIKK